MYTHRPIVIRLYFFLKVLRHCGHRETFLNSSTTTYFNEDFREAGNPVIHLHVVYYRIPSISVIGSWGRINPGQYSRGCSGMVSFIFKQSGTPLPPGGLIILVTRRPELSAILNWTSFECNGFRSPF